VKRILFPLACVLALSLGLGGLAGCGGSAAATIPPPTISSFAATPATITAGASSSLTAVFADGTGVITPGNLPVSSGTGVSVSPATTTTYTLTVTNSAGTAVSETATITVIPAPAITSFGATPATITGGGSSSLTAVFANGSGVITPGNLPVTSGAPVSVSPTATTTYTLTVTNSNATAVTQSATVTVVPAPAITSFAANPTTITVGGSSSLTAVFANGTAVITPGNLAATSGTPVSVSPTATTTYTLTVTNSNGTPVTQTATVTVDPAPTITSFAATPATITAGGSSSLTAVFANGTAVIMPGNLAATSGTPVSVSPTTTTTYTVTVTNSAGTSVTQTATVTVVPAPAISAFVAIPATITIGGSSNLTAVFTNGTGIITPGNLAATSSTPVSVSPTTTTTYTVTVTNSNGTAVTQTATVTVVPLPTITSFVANPPAIVAGAGTSSSLTAVFANGTGVITPGNLAVTSATPVSVSPTTTTTYTLTVTPPTGPAITQTATVTVQTSITVDQSSSGPAVTGQLLGMNLAAWYDVVGNATAVDGAFAQAGIQAIRWPGGSWSDEYHWQTPNTSSNPNLPYMCENNLSGIPNGSTDWGGYSTFGQFVSGIVQGGNLDLALTADYGTDPACTGPGDPTEAGAWVTAALADGIQVSHVTVGNEVYGSWETDLHTLPHDPATYANATVTGYYPDIKAASPGTLVGVDVDADNITGGWDNTVLAKAKGYYDFVEFHYYPETPGEETDSFLVQHAAQDLTNNINTLKSELNKWGTPDTPIYVGEIGGPFSSPGKQSWSITQGLYAGQVLGEMMNAGISRLTWWIGFGNCDGDSGNDSSSLYGWQNFGAYNVFADGPGDTGGTNNSPCNYGGPIGTMSPTARAFQLFSNVAVNGENVLTAAVAGDTTDVVAYAATHSGGTALVLFNRNETVSVPVAVTLSAQSAATTVTVITYEKAIYDLSGSPTGTIPDPNGTNTWAAPTTTNLGAQSLPLSLTLDPWSMNVVIIN